MTHRAVQPSLPDRREFAHHGDFPHVSTVRWDVYDEPYTFGVADAFLPQPLYRRLRDEFPRLQDLPSQERLQYGKQLQRIRPEDRLNQFAHLSETWRGVVATVRSAAFLDDLRRWSATCVTPSHRPAPSSASYLRLLGPRPAVREWTVDVTCEFATLQRGTMLPPHTDSIDKILVFLLYFPPEGWQAAWGGGTQVYRPHDRRYDSNWSNSRMPRRAVETVFDSTFKPNRLFFFVKSSNSWHGIAPLACPEHVLRRSFNFSVCIPAAHRRSRTYRLQEAIIGRIERRRFRRFRSYD